MNWAADYYGPDGAGRRTVQIRVEPGGLRFDLDGFVLWPYSEIRMTQGFSPGETVRFVRGAEPAPTLVIADRRILLETERYAPALRQVQREGALGRTLGFFAALALLCVVAIGLLFYFGVPLLGESLAKVVPVSAEDRLGEMVASQLAPPSSLCGDSELTSGVQAIMRRLLDATGQHPYQFRVVVTDHPAMNALAAPGGHVVIFRGLIRQADSPEELAGVLAHEIQHVLERHSTQGILREAGATALLTLIFGDAGGMIGLAQTLGSLQFNRDDESEADEKGLELMERASIDTGAMVRMFEKLSKESPDLPAGLNYLSTHPRIGDRIEVIEKLRSRGGRVQPILAGNWMQVRDRCR